MPIVSMVDRLVCSEHAAPMYLIVMAWTAWTCVRLMLAPAPAGSSRYAACPCGHPALRRPDGRRALPASRHRAPRSPRIRPIRPIRPARPRASAAPDAGRKTPAATQRSAVAPVRKEVGGVRHGAPGRLPVVAIHAGDAQRTQPQPGQAGQIAQVFAGGLAAGGKAGPGGGID